MAFGLAIIGVLFLVTGAGRLMTGGDGLWFSIVWIAIGLGFIGAAVVSAIRQRRAD